MEMETLKQKPLGIIGAVLREAYKRPGTGGYINQWHYDHMIRQASKGDPEVAAAASKLFDWGRNNPAELEIFIAKRSPSTAAKLAVSNRRRLCPEAEKFVTAKAGDRATLLEYCGQFGIVLDDLTKITMKAAFNDEATREKRYIKKLDSTKRTVRSFLSQMVNIGRIDPNVTVKELIESLE